ncbi:MAG: hypothetical protein K2G14_01380 [Ruminococcus sp.]|nr:hypothetical protein [Ruminococcus sp.]
MQTIIIKLDSRKLKNPDLDIRYTLPEHIEKYTNGKITDNGYDYITNTELGIWLETENSSETFSDVIEIMKKETFHDNDLCESAEVYISTKENAELNECKKVYPVEISDYLTEKFKRKVALMNGMLCETGGKFHENIADYINN